MTHAIDFHFHSLYSDGNAMPETMVASAKMDNPRVACLALTDHDTFAGCERFIKACSQQGVRGFVSAEIAGSHRDYPEFELHLIANLGPAWNASVAERADLFHAYWNSLRQTDHRNLFLFLEKAAEQGVFLSFRDVTRKAMENALAHGPDDHGLIRPVAFSHVRKLLREKGLDDKGRAFEKAVWETAGLRPVPTPPIDAAYDAFRKAGPVVTLAHPMHHPWTMRQARAVIEELKAEIGLTAIEAHYQGRAYAEWIACAQDMGLLVSAGSDCHTAGYGLPHPETRRVYHVQEADETVCDLHALIEKFEDAGNG